MESSNTFRPQLKSLTSRRFFAATSVVLLHLQPTRTFVAAPGWQRDFASIGHIGVSCFCVPCGFILVYTHAGSS
jgi:peptidoglycan/LPS O-acetylase OafA/YrhL